MARDAIHFTVRRALEKEGWEITHDPYFLENHPGQQIDLGAERMLFANRGIEKIAVEIKSFSAASKIYKFYEALGQYISYAVGVEIQEPDRILFLALPDTVYNELIEFTTVPQSLERGGVSLIVVNLLEEKIVAWIP